MKFVLATANKGKIREMREILSELGIEVMTQSELGMNIEVEETGTTFMENALLKAEAVCKATGLPAIADDSGLMVDALGGAPGVYSSSYGGDALSNADRCAYLLGDLRNVEQRRAKFVCTIVCVFPNGRIVSSDSECLGEIADSPRGDNGFGYDPVFLVEGAGKTMAELSQAEKNVVSHRGKALRNFARVLSEHIIES